MTEENPNLKEAADWRLEWVVHPARRHPWKTVATLVVLFLTWGIVYVVSRNVVFVGIAIIFLLVSLAQYFLPVTFRVGLQGVQREFLGRRTSRSWQEIRSIHEDRNGSLLSPFAGKSMLEMYRGIYLRFDGNRKEVMEYVRAKAKQAGEGMA